MPTEPIMLDYYDGESGRHLFSAPVEAIDDCSRPGQPADDAVEYWRSRVTWHADQATMRRMLQGYGAWEHIDTEDEETIKGRVLWIGACDLRENGELAGARMAEAPARTQPKRSSDHHGYRAPERALRRSRIGHHGVRPTQ